jgi:hypothetical protein
VEHGDTNIFMATYARPFRQLSHSIGVGTSRILKDRIMGFSVKNRRYASSNPTNNENEGGRSLIETSDDNGDGNDVMRPPIPNFGCDTRVNDMVCNNGFVYRKKSLYFIYGLIISICFILGWTIVI